MSTDPNQYQILDTGTPDYPDMDERFAGVVLAESDEESKTTVQQTANGWIVRDWELLDADGEGLRRWFCRSSAMITSRVIHAISEASNGAPGISRELVREYMDASDAYNAATRPPNSHAMPRRLAYRDPVLIRYMRARKALREAAQ